MSGWTRRSRDSGGAPQGAWSAPKPRPQEIDRASATPEGAAGLGDETGPPAGSSGPPSSSSEVALGCRTGARGCLGCLSIVAIALTILAVALRHCGNCIVRSIREPGGTHAAVLFRRTCGDIHDKSLCVSVLPQGAQLANDQGNASIAMTDSNGDWRRGFMDIQWAGRGHLLVRRWGESFSVLENPGVDGVEISYRSAADGAGREALEPRSRAPQSSGKPRP